MSVITDPTPPPFPYPGSYAKDQGWTWYCNGDGEWLVLEKVVMVAGLPTTIYNPDNHPGEAAFAR